ncbi:ARID DNA-binding domain-containing protein [Tanacetum coccineum]|uniref:ARID DNA-binding domain-containing protein n=1 Tax=Tanacetum coccineum TaxID=301880 RepID=A0ABQ5BN55_9ASTR
MPTKEEGKDRDCLGSHPWNFGETGANITRNAVQKAKGKVEHFGDLGQGKTHTTVPVMNSSSSLKEQAFQVYNLGEENSKPGKHLERRQHLDFLQRELRRQRKAKLGSCIKQMSRDCKEMLRKKLDEIMQYNTTLNQPQSTSTAQDKYKNYKCFQCKQLGHIVKFCPMDDNNKDMDTKTDSSNFAREGKVSLKPSKPSVMLNNKTDKHLCYKLESFCNIKEDFSVNRLENQRKFLFTYGIGEVLIKDGGHGLLVPGVHYAPEVTLNILSLDLLKKQGYEVKYENNRCSLAYMFDSKESQKFDEDKMRILHNNYLEDYFESLAQKNESMEEDLIKIKGNLYSTKVQTFNDYVTFLNLIKQDDLVSQEWDFFRNKFNKVVKWFYNHYLERSIPGPIPPTIKGIQIHLFDLYKLMEGSGGYLSVHFCQEFDTIGEILGLSKGNGEEIKECYMKYLDVLTSYFKTARAPQKEYTGGFNQIIPKMPTKEEGKDRDCLGSHPWNFGETGANITRNAVQKAKGKVEHFGVKLEDTEEEDDSQEQPILSHSTKAHDLQGMELGTSTSRTLDKEDSYNSSSDELIIIT